MCRARAKIRKKQLSCWLDEWTELLVGHRQVAEFQAALLAVTLSLGRATVEGAGTACLVWAMAYDTLDLQFLQEALLKAGVHETIVKLAFGMDRAMRTARIGDGVGKGRMPICGMAAGCPFATFFLAVVTQPWRSNAPQGQQR